MKEYANFRSSLSMHLSHSEATKLYKILCDKKEMDAAAPAKEPSVFELPGHLTIQNLLYISSIEVSPYDPLPTQRKSVSLLEASLKYPNSPTVRIEVTYCTAVEA